MNLNVDLTNNDSVATIQFKQADSPNSIWNDLLMDMNTVINGINKNNDIRVVVIKGSKDSFYDGMYLENIFTKCLDDRGLFKEVIDISYIWWKSIKDLTAKTICSVRGDCFGASIVLIGACDLAIASHDAKFRLTRVNSELLPSGWTSWDSVSNYKMEKAFYDSITGKSFNGKEAQDFSLVNKSVPPDELDKETDELIMSVLNNGKIDSPHSEVKYKRLRHLDIYEGFIVSGNEFNGTIKPG